jgi:hypothetical protein
MMAQVGGLSSQTSIGYGIAEQAGGMGGGQGAGMHGWQPPQ